MAAGVSATDVVAIKAGTYSLASVKATSGSKKFGMDQNIYYGRNGGGLGANSGLEVKSGSMIAFKLEVAATVKFKVKNSKTKSITDTWDVKAISDADFAAIIAQYDAQGNAATYYSNSSSALSTLTITHTGVVETYTNETSTLQPGCYGFYLSSHSADGDYITEIVITGSGGGSEKSTDATLNKISYELKGAQKTVDLSDKMKFDFTETLPEGTEVTDITNFAYDPTDSKVSSKSDNFSQMNTLPFTVVINITAEDGTTKKEYKVTFKVKSSLSDDATLKSLNVEGKSVPDFSPTKTDYTVTFDCNVKKNPVVTAEANDPNAKKDITQVEGGAPGTATVVVTAQDGTTKTYTVKINCESKDYEPAKSVTIEPSSLKLYVGQTGTLTATVDPSTADQNITWSSNDQKIATVDANGLVTAVAKGSTKIKATSGDGKKYKECSVTVEVYKPSSVTVGPAGGSVEVGKTLQMQLTVEPAEALPGAKITWKSSKTAIATIDQNGLVTGVAIGETEISCVVENGGTSKTGKCKITVSPSSEDPNPDAGKDLKIHVPDIYEAADGYKGKLVNFGGHYYEVYYINRDGDDKLSVAVSNQDKAGAITNGQDKKSTAAKDGWLTVQTSGDSGGDTGGAAKDEFQQSIRKLNIKEKDVVLLRVKGFDEFALYAKDNGTTEEKSLAIYINGKKQPAGKTNSYSIRRFTLDASTDNIIKITAFISSNSNVVAFSLREAQIPTVRYIDGDTAKQTIRVTDAIAPINYFIKNSSIDGKTVKTELSWADNKVASGIELKFNAAKDTATLSGTALCAAGTYRYYVVTTLDGVETSRTTGTFSTFTDIKAMSDTLIDAYVGEDMEPITLRYFAQDGTAIHIEWKDNKVPEGLTLEDNKNSHLYTMSGKLTGTTGTYRFTVTVDGNADARITGSIDVIKQDLGVNPILFLYRDKSLRKQGTDDIKDAVFTHLQSKNYNVKARRALNKLRDEAFYKQFIAVIISEDVNSDDEEALGILRGNVNLPILNMNGFTYSHVAGWGMPDNGTLDTITQNGSNIFIQRGEHPIFSKFADRKTGTKITILDFKKLKASGLHSVMPIAVTMSGSYCLATAYTRSLDADYQPHVAYYKDGEKQTIIHEIPSSMRGEGAKKYIGFPLSQKCTDYLTADGKTLIESIMAYLLSADAASLKQPTMQITDFSIDDIKADINQDNNTIELTMDTVKYNALDSLREAVPVITLAEPGLTFVRPWSEEAVSLQYSMLVPYEFVVSDYIRRRVYEFTLHLTYPQGIEDVYVAGEWVNIYDMYGRKVATTNENIYTMDLPRGIYIAVTATGQTIKIMR